MHLLRSKAGAVLAFVIALRPSVGQQHVFSVRDDIDMRRINSPHVEPHLPGSEIAWPSPDGSAVAVVTSRGLLKSDLIESQVLLFDVGTIRRALTRSQSTMPAPQVIATVRSVPTAIETDAYAPVIKDLRWSQDGTRLYFRATNLLGNYQLCTVLRSGVAFRRLTPQNQSVDRFDIGRNTIVYNASDPTSQLIAAGERINRDAINITGARIQDVLFPDDVTAHAAKVFRLYTLKRQAGASGPQIAASLYALEEIPYLTALYPFKISPNGKKIVKLEPPASVPESWKIYQPAPGLDHLRLTDGHDPRLLRSDNVLRPLEYTMIDLKTGQRVPLLEAPNARSLGYAWDQNRVAWSPNGRRVLVTNTFLPDRERNLNVSAPCLIACVDLPSQKVRCLTFGADMTDLDAAHVQDIAFATSADEALVLLSTGSRKQVVRRYRLQGGEWSLVSSQFLSDSVQDAAEILLPTLKRARPITIYVNQTLNDPPALWARDAEGRKREIWDPNPQLLKMKFGLASSYQWKDAGGSEWSGILIKPINYIPQHRYPAVLQMYNYIEDQFITDGLYPTAFAARELASAGFVVLQIRKRPNTVSEDDARIHLEGYRSAIRSLATEGLIDPAKVGVVGFSWTCWYVAHALVEDPKLFAAATIADGLDNSYMQYKLFTPEDYILDQQMTKIRGGPPFGAGLEHWVNSAPGFRADRIEAPVRIEAIGHSSVLQEWELYSSLRLLAKPVDLIYFPNGSHIHELPLERLESQQGNVDWLRFWLRNEVDEDPSKREQYLRWKRIRDGSDGIEHLSSALAQ